MRTQFRDGIPIVDTACSCGRTFRGYTGKCRPCQGKAYKRRIREARAICVECPNKRPVVKGREFCDQCRDARIKTAHTRKFPRFCKDCGKSIPKGLYYCDRHRLARRAATMRRFAENRKSLKGAGVAEEEPPRQSEKQWADLKALELLREFEETHKIQSAARRLHERIRVGHALMRRRGMLEASASTTIRGSV